MHGSGLIKALLSQLPDMQIYGMGGELMKAAGAVLFCQIGRISVIGFIEVVKKLPLYKNIFKGLCARLDSEKPDAVILIDYPGFNVRFAKEAKKRNIPVIYYISPQVWAWHKGRIETIRRCVDKMLVLFEFEKALYKSHNVDAVFVGHPLVETTKTSMSKEEAARTLGLDSAKKAVALLPGSRKTEVKKILPVMLKTAGIMARRNNGGIQFILIKSPIVDLGVYEKMLEGSPLQIKIVGQDRCNAINACGLALVASGTATLEAAILGVPMVLVYKVSFLTWLIARALIRIPYIGLVNVIAGEKIVPEFIQFGARPEKIAAECLDILNSSSRTALLQSQLNDVKKKLGPPGASANSAAEIISFLNRRDANAGLVG